MPLVIGKKSPSFSLSDQTGHIQKLSDVKESFTVIYFYPKDDTPGCTLEGQEFTKLLKAFSSSDAKIFGISGLDYKSKAKFCVKQKIGVTLLSDPDFAVSKAFSSYGEKKFMGRSYMGILRNTFILDKSKKIIKIYEAVKPEGHAAEVLAYIKSLAGVAAKKPKAVKKTTKAKPSSAKKVVRKKKK